MLGKYSRFSLLLVLIALLTQCQSLSLDMQKSGNMPRVIIEGVYREQVVTACNEVLMNHDFRFSANRGNNYLYERPSSTMEFLAWGGGFSSDQEVVVRLALRIRELGDSHEVDCQPFIVIRPGEHLEEARKMTRLKSRKYQKILNEIRARCYEGGELPEEWGAWD